MSIVFIRAAILYAAVIAAVRLMGKRQIGELQPSELAITILISNIATLPVEDPSIPLITGLVPIFTLATLDVLVGFWSLHSWRVRRILCGKPVIVISGGVIDQKKLKELRYTIDDLMEALRSYGIFDISEVQFAVVETTGALSVYEKTKFQAAEKGDVGANANPEDPPVIIVQDGILIPEALNRSAISEKRFAEILSNKHLKTADIFLMSVKSDGSFKIVKKERQL